MSIMQELENSLTSDAPVYLEFLRRFNPKKTQVFAFYEGDEDTSYYYSVIRNYLGTNCEIEELIAGCKNNIIKLLKEFNWSRYNREQICFYVDNDLSFWLGEKHPEASNLFVTDGYSVENYLVSDEMFSILMTQVKGFGRASKADLENVCSQFSNLCMKYTVDMMEIMALCVCAKKRNRDISLSEFKLTHALNFYLEDGELHFSISEAEMNSIKDKWRVADLSQSEIDQQVALFKKDIAKYHVRGKWLLYFMVVCGEFIRCNFELLCPSLIEEEKKRIKPCCEIHPTKAVPVLGPRCYSVPESLKVFMERNYKRYIYKQCVV